MAIWVLSAARQNIEQKVLGFSMWVTDTFMEAIKHTLLSIRNFVGVPELELEESAGCEGSHQLVTPPLTDCRVQYANAH